MIGAVLLTVLVMVIGAVAALAAWSVLAPGLTF